MTMSHNGLTKLTEECGELTQIAMKKIAFADTDVHPDGKGSMKLRLEEEIADVRAASQFVIDNFDLDEEFIKERAEQKLSMFAEWHNQSNMIVSTNTENIAKQNDGTPWLKSPIAITFFFAIFVAIYFSWLTGLEWN